MKDGYTESDMFADLDLLDDAAEAIRRLSKFARRMGVMDESLDSYFTKTKSRVENIIFQMNERYDTFIDEGDACYD